MILYTYDHPGMPHGVRAFTSLREARRQRAEDFVRRSRPEIMRVDIGKLDAAKACALLSGQNYAVKMEDVA